jgi:hypothetical protein
MISKSPEFVMMDFFISNSKLKHAIPMTGRTLIAFSVNNFSVGNLLSSPYAIFRDLFCILCSLLMSPASNLQIKKPLLKRCDPIKAL